MTPSELHRQYYLQASGIRLWYAKRPLPGAAPSPDFWFPEEEEAPPVAAAELPVASPVPRPSASQKPARSEGRRSVDLKSLMADQSTEKPSATKSISEVSHRSSAEHSEASLPDEGAAAEPVQRSGVSAPAQSDAAMASANLAIWASDKYLLVSQWSDEASASLQDSLASNLLKALGDQVIGDRQSFQWPVFRNPGVPGNSGADMNQAVGRFLSAFEGQSLILLGDFTEQSDSQRTIWLQPFESGRSLEFPHSLAELASAPAYKRALWESLKATFLR